MVKNSKVQHTEHHGFLPRPGPGIRTGTLADPA